ncbi:MAG: uL15m family ribosomal protein, partial [Bacteroidota bacterium]
IEVYNPAEISPEILYYLRMIKKNDRIKVLGNGDLTAKINVKAHAYSKSAISKIEALGGTAETV